MPSFKVILVGLIGATSTLANPVSSPSKVRRDPPAPSAYPLDGGPCTNEWQYLNFDPSDATDTAHLQQLHEVACFDVSQVVIAGLSAVSAVNKIYLRYFPASDDEDDFQGHVTSVYNQIYDEDSGVGGVLPLVGTFIVDNLDYNAGTDSVNCEDGGLAYTDTDPLDDREKIHFCDPAYDRPDIYTAQCSSFDTFPSPKMDTLARIGLHEMCHYSSVGPPSALGQQIVDTLNEDGFPAYDPDRTHGLVDVNQDDNPAVTEINADSYAWMALDAYWSFACTTDPSDSQDYFTDPPNYEHGDDDSDEAA